MEVTRASFHTDLPRLLSDITESCCVALDLEFSGIFSRLNRTAPANGSSDGGRSLQSRYEEVKEAAEKYQILQVGLTFIKEDAENETYTLRPYNFYVNPIIDPKLDLERTWMYQSSAINVLLESGFCMQGPFVDGIPYISREEEGKAQARLRGRNARLAALDQINYESLDEESTAFLADVRRAIGDWVGKENKGHYLNIPGAEGTTSATPKILNNYQKRLVHQLVRSEYSGLVTLGKSTFVQIVEYDEKREENVLKSKMRQLRERIYSQMGLRWLIEAMVGGDVSRLSPPSLIGSSPRGKGNALDQCDELRAKLKAKRLILVGHNLFTDLVNFYKCFFGSLPDTVEEFLVAIHELFPIIVDTKYLATYDCGTEMPSSMLMEIDEKLNARQMPVIAIDPDHTKYSRDKPLHEAGYDSMVTARVFLRLASQLSEKGEHLVSDADPLTEANPVEKSMKTLLSENDLKDPPSILASSSITSTLVIRERGSSEAMLEASEVVEETEVVTETTDAKEQRVAVAHATKFDALLDQMNEDASDDSNSDDTTFEDAFLTSGGDPVIETKIREGRLIPRLDDKFWKVYGNKLRMFGTAQRFCELSD